MKVKGKSKVKSKRETAWMLALIRFLRARGLKLPVQLIIEHGTAKIKGGGK